MNRVEITRAMIGLTAMQVCAEQDATDKEILETCNAQNPSGTRGGWSQVIRRTNKKTGMKKRHLPIQCKEYKDRKHFLVIC